MSSGTPPRWGLAQERLNALYRCRAALGTPPQQPPTWRGHLGMFLVLAVRRALFWLLPQLDRFHGATIEMVEEELQALEELSVSYERLDASLGRTLTEFARRHSQLQREVALLRAELRQHAISTESQGRVATR